MKVADAIRSLTPYGRSWTRDSLRGATRALRRLGLFSGCSIHISPRVGLSYMGTYRGLTLDHRPPDYLDMPDEPGVVVELANDICVVEQAENAIFQERVRS